MGFGEFFTIDGFCEFFTVDEFGEFDNFLAGARTHQLDPQFGLSSQLSQV